MTCIVEPSDNACNFDYQVALSVANYSCEGRLRKDWQECSKSCGPSHATCSAAASSSAMPHTGLSMPKSLITDYWLDEDGRSTAVASPRSVRSLCDEPEDFEPADFELAETEPSQQDRPARKVNWSELVDSESEEETRNAEAANADQTPDTAPAATLSVAAQAARWADISESEDEFMEGHASPPVPASSKEALPPQPSRPSRSSRRARTASSASNVSSCAELDVQQSSAAKEEGGAWTAVRSGKKDCKGAGKVSANKDDSEGKRHSVEKNADKRGADKWAAKGAEKGAGKGAGQSAGKGDGQSTGKAAGKGGKAAGKGGKAAGKGGKAAGKGSSDKYQCQIIVGVEEDNKFRVVRRVIGSGGENMKNINEQSQARLRLRGRGSKFLEGAEQQESTDDLMLCISANEKAGYEKAKAMAVELIESIQHSYRSFCSKAGKECPDFKLQIHEGYRDGSR